MKTKGWCAATIVLGLFVTAALTSAVSEVKASGKAPSTDAERTFRAARGYTVRIRTRITTPFIQDSQGSYEGAGFLVDARRHWIVTNAHVVGHSPSAVEVAFVDQPFQSARKLYVDSFTDVAILQVEDLPNGVKAPEIGFGDEVRVGETIGVFGHPLGMYFTGTRGIISNKTDQDGPDLMQIDATVDHGNSGGPVIDLSSGRVVGIATAGVMADKSDRLNFATPMKDVCRILSLMRAGTSPSPPRLEFALLRNEEGSYTMNVARTFEPARWPLEADDRIVAVAGQPVRTLTDLVCALRGSGSRVPLTIERGGVGTRLEVMPLARDLVTEQRGLLVDGALIAPLAFDDQVSLRDPWRLVVQSVEPGSTAESLGLQGMDSIHTVNGRSFTDLDSLSAYLHDRSSENPIHLVLRRVNTCPTGLFEYVVRDLPGDEVKPIGPEGSDVVAKHE
jgi:S1-C subfamily serine protease